MAKDDDRQRRLRGRVPKARGVDVEQQVRLLAVLHRAHAHAGDVRREELAGIVVVRAHRLHIRAQSKVNPRAYISLIYKVDASILNQIRLTIVPESVRSRLVIEKCTCV